MNTSDKILNDEQLQAIRHGTGPILIIAGAGTGKTTVITERIKYLIEKELARPSEILALTFTEKAAREMEERVDKAMPYGYTQMWISTFHSFCDRILKSEVVHIGLNPGYKLMTEAESTLYLRKNLFKLDLEYFRPLGNPNKFITGMLQHFSRLKDEDITPDQYLEWIKNERERNRHSGEEGSLADRRLQNPSSWLDQEQKDSGQARMTDYQDDDLLKYHELANAYQKYEDLKVKDGLMDFSDLISNVLKLFRKRPGVLKQYQNQFKFILVDEYQDTNIAQNEMVKMLAGEKQNLTVVCDDDQAIYKWRGASVSNVIQFRRTFPNAKLVVLTKNYRSTQEILDRAYDLIQHNNPDRLEVKEKIDKRLKTVRKENGIKPEFIHTDRVENEAEEVAKKIMDLILMSDASYLNRHSGKSLLVKDAPRISDIIDSGQAGMTEKYEYKDIAVLIRANSHADPFSRAFLRHNIPFQFLGPGLLFRQPEVKDLIAYLKVLYNYEDNIAMYRLLTMEHWGISGRDIAAILNLAKKLNCSLFEACEKISASTVIQKDLDYHDSYFNPNPLVPILEANTKEKIKLITQIIHRHLNQLSKETAGQICYYFLKDSGLLPKLIEFKSDKEEKAAQNISKFFDKLKSYETGHEDALVHAVVDWIDLCMEMGESPMATDTDWVGNNAVNILTVHSSKGLEFPVVFVVNLVSQRFPTIEKHEQIPIPEGLIKEILPEGDSHLEEERRLFYVAMTRARDRLFLTAADFYGEGKREKKLSPFISESLGEQTVKSLLKKQPHSQLSLLEWEKPTEEIAVKTKIPVTFLSFSQLETYNICPLQYKFKYLLRIPSLPGAAASFGDTMHKTLYTLYKELKNGTVLSKDQLLTVFENYWSPVGYRSKEYEEKMKIRGEKALTAFYKKVFDKNAKPLALEQKFSMPIAPSLKIGGKIDRVDDIGEGRIEIIDYKTGKVPSQKDIEKNLQMTIYALAASGKYMFDKEPKDIVLSFYFFENQEKISNTRTKEQLESAKALVLEKAKEIEDSNFTPTPGPMCDYCDFKLLCEAWK